MSLARRSRKLAATLIALAFLATSSVVGAASATSNRGGHSTDAEPVTITFAAWQLVLPQGPDIVQAVVDTFEAENPDINVELGEIPFASYQEVIANQLATDEAPDVLAFNEGPLAQAVAAGAVEPLDDIVDTSGFVDDLLPQNDWGIFNGTRYAYLFQLNTQGLYYRTDILEAAGIDPPTTLEELIDAAVQLTDESEGRYGFSMRSRFAEARGWMPALAMWVAGYGARIVDDEGMPTVNTPEMKEALEAYMSVYNSGGMLVDTPAETFRQAFAAGNVAMIMDNALGTSVSNFPELEGKVSAVPPPFPHDDPVLLPIYIGIAANSQHKEEAARFLEHFLSRPVQDELSLALAGGLPATFHWETRTEAYMAMVESTWPWVGPIESRIEEGIPMITDGPSIEYSEQITDIFLQGVERVQLGSETIDEMLERVQGELDELIE